MRHDRGLEEPPEHPDDCGCRECRPVTTQERTEPDWDEHPEECDCRECTHPGRDEQAMAIMRGDTSLCSETHGEELIWEHF